MPKKIDPALRERAVRLVLEHRAEYLTTTAAVQAVAKHPLWCGAVALYAN